MENERYNQAIKGFETLIEQLKDQEKNMTYWSVLFNLGSTYEHTQQCQKAEKTYQQLLSLIKNNSTFEAQTLLRLHYVYDCLGQLEKSLTFLKDADKKSHKLNKISQLVEIPARFSILYMQLNKKNESFNYQNKAFSGIKKLKSPIKDSRLLDEKGSELFYIMGRSFSHPSYIQMDHYLKALPVHQIYLIQSILLSESFWSQLAQKELYSLYDKLLKAYLKLSLQKRSLYQNRIMESLRDLQKLSRESPSSRLKKIQIDIVDKTLDQIKDSKKTK